MAKVNWSDGGQALDHALPAKLSRAERRKFNRRQHALTQLQRAEEHWRRVCGLDELEALSEDAMAIAFVGPDDPGGL